MSSERRYPRRLIEVDLPIKQISAHARREKSIRHGHISTLHIWWSRKPLAACRAVILAALWPDPADPLCPERFRVEATKAMKDFRDQRGGRRREWDDPLQVRAALLDFIAEFANWDNSTNAAHLEVARRLVLVAHESLGGAPGTRPLVVDPFAGGGALPLEALRVGADAFASDLNPVAVLLNKLVLEYIPKHGSELAEEVRRWGAWVKERAEKELARFYPIDPDGTVPIAYLWKRVIRCEGPACGKVVPLARSFWLTKRGSGSAGVRMDLLPDTEAPRFVVADGPRVTGVSPPTVRGGSALCPWCGHTTPVGRVREQISRTHGGANAATLFAVVVARPSGARGYRSPTESDLLAVKAAHAASEELRQRNPDAFPTESLPPRGTLGFRVQGYGMEKFEHLHTSRQLVTLATIAEAVRDVERETGSEEVAAALSLALGRLQDLNSSLSMWADTVIGANRAQNRVSMIWDFAEAAPLAGAGGGWDGQVDWVARVVDAIAKSIPRSGTVSQAPAQSHPLPDDSAQLLATDPPYYDAFGYADLADLFLVWLKRAACNPGMRFPGVGADGKTPKNLEIVVNPSASADGRGPKDHEWFSTQMRRAFEDARRVVAPDGLGIIVFAHKETKSWEALLSAVVDAGWIVTGSWPIDTERPNRQRALGSAALASSIQLVCRPRENPDGSVNNDAVGDWRAVLRELPVRIHEWMPRLAKEGVVGADAIFACIGPALEIFSRYSCVEKASGERVALREYLEQVWAAVAREALSMIFEDADATGLEEDARLTAMWLWTLSTSANGGGNGGAGSAADDEDGAESEEDEEEGTGKAKPSAGFSLEFDAARKIAQGLGAHLEDLGRVVEIKGDQARLLSVAERTRHLFGKDQAQRAPARRAKKVQQLTLFEELDAAEKDAGWGDVGLPPAGETTLDRVHQAMVLFAAGRGEALKRFLVEEGVGRAATFWKLAQSLSALYPAGTDEKRWVDGVLARKKGLGFG
jgi:putative DNA methylase